jgi:hypothetical protein
MPEFQNIGVCPAVRRTSPVALIMRLLMVAFACGLVFRSHQRIPKSA